jgi:type III restriction enzyme
MDQKGARWILETKGAETGDVPYKDAAAMQWCENATALTGKKWMYLKVQQKAFETLQPTRFEHLSALRAGI